jgi:hypothetical protein
MPLVCSSGVHRCRTHGLVKLVGKCVQLYGTMPRSTRHSVHSRDCVAADEAPQMMKSLIPHLQRQTLLACHSVLKIKLCAGANYLPHILSEHMHVLLKNKQFAMKCLRQHTSCRHPGIRCCVPVCKRPRLQGVNSCLLILSMISDNAMQSKQEAVFRERSWPYQPVLAGF